MLGDVVAECSGAADAAVPASATPKREAKAKLRDATRDNECTIVDSFSVS
jgi:hypothetical protein